MPDNRTRKGSFRGGLLEPPRPIPEDDKPAPRPPQAVPDVDLTEASPPAVATTTDEDEDRDLEPAPDPAPTTTLSSTSGKGSRTRATRTVRLNDVADDLWAEYLLEKQADPFLSYTQFASNIVGDGISAHRRRKKRSA